MTEKMCIYELWMDGFFLQGDDAPTPAHLIGRYEARSFKEAYFRMIAEKYDNNPFFNLIELTKNSSWSRLIYEPNNIQKYNWSNDSVENILICENAKAPGCCNKLCQARYPTIYRDNPNIASFVCDGEDGGIQGSKLISVFDIYAKKKMESDIRSKQIDAENEERRKSYHKSTVIEV